MSHTPVKTASDIVPLASDVCEPIELALCEHNRIIPRPDTLYIYREISGCKECKRLANVYREASHD